MGEAGTHREGGAHVLSHAGVVCALVHLDDERVPGLGLCAGGSQRASMDPPTPAAQEGATGEYMHMLMRQ